MYVAAAELDVLVDELLLELNEMELNIDAEAVEELSARIVARIESPKRTTCLNILILNIEWSIN